MSAPVSDWLSGMGYTVYAEVALYDRNIDLVGKCDDILVAVELKTSFTKRLVGQAAVNQVLTPWVYAAVATQPKSSSVETCRKFGLGLLRVADGGVEVILDPWPTWRGNPGWAARTPWDRMVPGGVGGLPNRAGEGPACDVERRVEAYRGDHPSASWDEMFQAIPNHYANARSMMGSMNSRDRWRHISAMRKKRRRGMAK